MATANATLLDSNIVVQSGTITDDLLWKFSRTTNGAYKIISKSSGINEWVLTTFTSNYTNDVKLILGQYVDNYSYRDEWFLCRQNNSNYNAFLLSIYHTGNASFSTYQGMGNSIHYLQDLGYLVNFIKSEYVHFNDLRDYLSYATIAVIGSHGGHITDPPECSVMSLYNKQNGIYTSYLSSTDIYNQDTHFSNIQLSNLDLIIFLGCETGAGQYNLCTQSVYSYTILDGLIQVDGANVAIGFKGVIQSPYCNDWLRCFFAYYSYGGYSIEQSVHYASSFFGTSSNGLNENSVLISFRGD